MSNWSFTLICFSAALVLVSSVNLGDLDINSPRFENYVQALKLFGDLSHCNKSLCSVPCPGAGPPPVCPDLVPYCISGCACYYNCEEAAHYCYETKECLNKRMYLTGKKRTMN